MFFTYINSIPMLKSEHFEIMEWSFIELLQFNQVNGIKGAKYNNLYQYLNHD